MKQVTSNLEEFVPNIAVYDYFGIDDPFGSVFIESEAIKEARRELRSTAKRGRILCIEGNVGGGKTTFLDLICQEKDNIIIRLEAENQAYITPKNISEAMICHLRKVDKYRPIPRSKILRKLELSELLYSEREKNIYLVLDDGQQFTAKTLQTLKRIREFDYMGKKHFFEVVILAHSHGVDRIKRIEEIARRLVVMKFKGFTKKEAKSYITQASGQFFADESVIDELVKRIIDYRPASVQAAVLMCLQTVMERGGKKVHFEDLREVIGLKALLTMKGISQRMIADRSGASAATVNRFLNGEEIGDESKKNAVKEEIEAVLEVISDKDRWDEREGIPVNI